MDKLGEKIKELRIQNGWTITELSEKSGVSYPILIKLEKGTYDRPTDLTIGKIANALNCDFKELLKLKG